MPVSYIGLPEDPGRPPNQYTSLGDYPQALYVVRGTILGSYQGLQYYDVATDFGRVQAFGGGIGRGLLGANEAAGYLPGEQVFLAVAPSAPAQNAVIIARADYARAGDYTRPCPLLVHPQVAGFKPGERFSGLAYNNFGRLRNFNSGVTDAVDGEWVMHNMFGGALGVEMFRVFLQAGPMCGIYGYTEDQHMKIVAARLDLMTLNKSTETEVLNGTAGEIIKSYFYPSDQVNGWQAQNIDVIGVAYNGDGEILTYPDGLNGADSRPDPDDIPEEAVDDDPCNDPDLEAEGQSRVALIHEHKGADGSYVLSAANSLTLQKTFEVPVPVDVIEAANAVKGGDDEDDDEDEDDEECCGSCELTPDPEPPGGLCEDDTCENEVNGPLFDSHDNGNPLAYAMNARGLADRIISQLTKGVTDLRRWALAEKPEAIFGSGAQEKSPADLLFNGDPAMWKNMPQTFKLGLTPEGKSKRFYWGRAIISITEDGSIVMQDAQGSQLMLSGGNIYLSANHDIVQVAGRNALSVSGRDTGVRAGRHLDLFANEGRLTAMASGEASLVGGLDGHHGVLIESKGQYMGTIATGENPPSAGSVIIRAPHMVGMRATNLMLQARPAATGWSGSQRGSGHIWLNAQNSVEMMTNDSRTYCSIASTFEGQFESGNVSFGGETSVIGTNLWVTESLFYNKRHFHNARGTGAAYYRLEQPQAVGLAFNQALNQFATNPLQVDGGFAARWLQTEQYTIGSSQFFQIPEPEWQIRAKAALDPKSSALQASMQDNTVEGTAPFPGRESWAGSALATGGYTATEFGEEAEVDLSIDNKPADGGLLKGI